MQDAAVVMEDVTMVVDVLMIGTIEDGDTHITGAIHMVTMDILTMDILTTDAQESGFP